MKKLRCQKGITLIVLVITIIVLLILAGISIQALTNIELFGQTKKSQKETKRAQVVEWLNIKLMEEKVNKIDGTAEEIVEGTRVASYGSSELAKMGKNVMVDENTNTVEDEQEVDVYFYVEVDEDIYKVDISEAKFIGEREKLLPAISIEDINTTVDSITIKISTVRNKEGKIEIYIKSEKDAEYTLKKTATGEEAKGLEYTFTELEQNVKYNIKIIATAKNGEKAEISKDISLEIVPENMVVIKFNANGGQGKMDQIMVTKGENFTLPQNVFTNGNKTFRKWNTKADGTGENYEDKAIIIPNENITLFAIWKGNVNYGTEILSSYGKLYVGTTSGTEVTKTQDGDACFNGNYQFVNSLGSKMSEFGYDVLNKQEVERFQKIISGTNVYDLDTESKKEIWIIVHIRGGGLTTRVIVGNFKLGFNDGNFYTLKEAVKNLYIEPLVICTSASWSKSYIWSGMDGFLEGKNTSMGDYSDAKIIFKVKSIPLNSINMYSSKPFNTSKDGLNVFQYSDDLEVSTTPW